MQTIKRVLLLIESFADENKWKRLLKKKVQFGGHAEDSEDWRQNK